MPTVPLQGAQAYKNRVEKKSFGLGRRRDTMGAGESGESTFRGVADRGWVFQRERLGLHGCGLYLRRDRRSAIGLVAVRI